MKERSAGSVWSYFAFCLCAALIPLTVGCGTSNPPAVGATQNPLVAEYTVAIPANGQAWVEFGTDTTYGRQTSQLSGSPGIVATTVPILVAGMKASTTYHMRAHITWGNNNSWVDQDQSFTTGALPARNALGLAVTRPSSSSVSQKGVELLNLVDLGSSALQSAVTDLDGNVIWYYNASPGDAALPVKPLANGHFITDVSNASGLAKLREIDLAGTTIREITSTDLDQALLLLGRSVTLNAFHHDILSLPNGHTILLANMLVPYDNLPGYPGTTNVLGDVLIDLDPNWNPVWFWSTFDHLDVNRHLQGLPDWTHSNAILYTPNDGNLVVSSRHQSWVMKIDYANGNGTGNILWKLGNEGDFTLGSGGAAANWFYAQHYPDILSINGSQFSMAVVDNGNDRVVDSTGDMCGASIPCYSRALLLNVDEAALVADIMWQDVPGLYSSWGGSIGVVDSGNVEYDLTAPDNIPTPPGFAQKSRVQEVTQDAAESVVWQMDIDGANAYRAYRIPSLYPGVTWTK
jgi:arylsulfate sulfotransferase